MRMKSRKKWRTKEHVPTVASREQLAKGTINVDDSMIGNRDEGPADNEKLPDEDEELPPAKKQDQQDTKVTELVDPNHLTNNRLWYSRLTSINGANCMTNGCTWQ